MKANAKAYHSMNAYFLSQLHAKQKCSILQKLMERTVFERRICYYFSTANNSRDDKFGLLLRYNCYPTPFLHFPIFSHFDTKYKHHRNVEWDNVIELHTTRLHIILKRFHHHDHHGMANPKDVNGTAFTIGKGGGGGEGAVNILSKQLQTDD